MGIKRYHVEKDSPIMPRFIPYNGKIADISEPDTEKHFLDLEAALGEKRKIIAIIASAERMLGTGGFYVYPNEGTNHVIITWRTNTTTIIIKNGTQRLQYAQTVAGDDFDLYCFGYIVEA